MEFSTAFIFLPEMSLNLPGMCMTQAGYVFLSSTFEPRPSIVVVRFVMDH